MTITVRYSCTLCGLLDATVVVPAREDAEVPVVGWVEQTMRMVAQDHVHRSPKCHPKMLHDLKIPMDGADWIGGPPIQ